MAKTKKFYAVRKGHQPGIYDNLADCRAACNGFPGQEFKGFSTRCKAQLYMDNASNPVIEPKKDYLQAFLETSTDVKDESSTYYAVARGKQPGVYTNRLKALEQTDNIEDAKHEGFNDLKDAIAYVKLHGNFTDTNEVLIFQSHFDNPQFRGLGFQHQPEASFDDNFNQLAASQGWTSDSNTLREQRALILKEELRSQYFPSIKEEDGTQLTEEESKLKGYQTLCRSVRKPAHETIAACVDELSNRPPWVNIKDLIDARRQRVQVQTFMDWRKFVKYTSKPGKRIDVKFAKQHEDLKPFLQRLSKCPHHTTSGSIQLRPSPAVGPVSLFPTPEIKLEPIPETAQYYRPTLLSQYEDAMEKLLRGDFGEENEDGATHSDGGNAFEDNQVDSKCKEEIQEWGVDINFDDEESNSSIKIKSEQHSQSDLLIVDCHVENASDIRDCLTADQVAINLICDLPEDALRPQTHSSEITSNSLYAPGTGSLKRKRGLSEKDFTEKTLDISATDGEKKRPRKRSRTKQPLGPVAHHEAGGLVWSSNTSGLVNADPLQKCYEPSGVNVSSNTLGVSLAGPKGVSAVPQKKLQAPNMGTGGMEKKKKNKKQKNKKKRHSLSKI